MLKILRDAIQRLHEPGSESFTSIASTENESDLPDSQELATSAPSSQNTAGFKKPRLPSKVMLQQRIDRLEEQNMELLKQQTPSTASTAELKLQREHDRAEGIIRSGEGREPERHQIVLVDAVPRAKRSFGSNTKLTSLSTKKSPVNRKFFDFPRACRLLKNLPTFI